MVPTVQLTVVRATDGVPTVPTFQMFACNNTRIILAIRLLLQVNLVSYRCCTAVETVGGNLLSCPLSLPPTWTPPALGLRPVPMIGMTIQTIDNNPDAFPFHLQMSTAVRA